MDRRVRRQRVRFFFSPMRLDSDPDLWGADVLRCDLQSVRVTQSLYHSCLYTMCVCVCVCVCLTCVCVCVYSQPTIFLSVNVCGSGRPCQLPQQSHAPVTPRRHDVPRCSRSHHTLAVARAPPVFFNAMIYQQQCCASVAHRAPTPRLAQLRPRSLCARSRPRRLAQTDNFFSGPTVSTDSEGLLFVP